MRRRAVAAAAFFGAVIVVSGLLLETGASRPQRHAAPARRRREGPAGNRPRTDVSRAARVNRSESQGIAGTLRYTSYVRLASARRRDLALTFDDGPSPYTPQILRILRRTHTPATFFVIGRSARRYPTLVAAEARAGFDVGDHTETHAFLSSLSADGQASEIEQAASAIRGGGAPSPQLFRPPYGSFSATTLAILHAQRMLMVLWSVDTSDYARPGPARIAYVAISGAQPGAIILMHDGGGDRSQTVAALPRIIRRLRQRHFHLVTVAHLVADDPPPASQPAPQPLSGIG